MAPVTHWLPGPATTSQRGIGATPYAIAATAWAPPAASKLFAPAAAAAANVSREGSGDATQTSLTPAARAVTAVMRTEDGRGKRPPGA